MLIQHLKEAEAVIRESRSALSRLNDPQWDGSPLDERMSFCAEELGRIIAGANAQLPVFIAWTNSDLTEGRGYEIPLVISECRATAVRLGRGQGVQGSDCRIAPWTAIKHEGRWVAPFRLEHPIKQDIEDERAQVKKEEALQRLRSFGLSDHEISEITQAISGQQEGK